MHSQLSQIAIKLKYDQFTHVPYASVCRSYHVFLATYGNVYLMGTRMPLSSVTPTSVMQLLHNNIGHLVGCVYNTDRIIRQSANCDVVLPSHFRYERHIDHLFEIQHVIFFINLQLLKS
jgi:hypothetical protein